MANVLSKKFLSENKKGKPDFFGLPFLYPVKIIA